jgi:DNA mismatch repair ATPase MutL
MSLLIFRCSDIIKQIGQKLLTIALDPEKQRFFFRIEILKHINDQPNAKAIMEYLLINDTQCYIYHQILIYLQILSKTTPNDSENEQPTNQTSLGQPQKPMDLGHVTISHTHHRVSNGEDSTHTVNISMRSNTKQNKQPAKTDVTQKESSSPDEEAHDLGQLSSSSSNNDEQEMPVGKTSERSSSSASPSISSLSSEVTPLQQSSIATYPNIINQFRDLLRLVNVPSLTANDNHVLQRRALTEYLLMSSPSTRRS